MTADFHIAGRGVGPGHPAFIIAEVGINHGGDEGVCAAMIAAAGEAGADAVKLQIVDPDESYHPDTDSYREFQDKVLPCDSLARLMKVAADHRIILFSTPGDMSSLALMCEVGMPAVKISSGLLTNIPLLRKAAETGLPLILSTGMAYLDEVRESVAAARAAGARDLAVLQCTATYPAPANSVNLRVMATLGDALELPIGYSDHHDGGLACVAAVAAGAALIEKHFTLDLSVSGADHGISMEPEDFARMVRDIRQVEAMLGSATKEPTETEEPQRPARHRRLVARRNIAAGEKVSAEDMLLMRLPPDREGLEARRLDDVAGHRAARPIQRLSGIVAADIEGMT